MGQLLPASEVPEIIFKKKKEKNGIENIRKHALGQCHEFLLQMCSHRKNCSGTNLHFEYQVNR